MADFSDQEQQVVILQSARVGFKANGCKNEHKQRKPITIIQNIEKAFRLVEPGLMLEGTCNTKQCFAFGKRALHCFGFVTKLNFASDRYEAVCRLCKNTLEDVNNIGYYQSVIKINGKYINKKGMINYEYKADDGQYHTFKNGEQQQQMWEFLNITTQKLKE